MDDKRKDVIRLGAEGVADILLELAASSSAADEMAPR
jgi:hypothetical protein